MQALDAISITYQMVDDHVEHEVHAPLVELGRKRLQVVWRTEM
jgi:hypothetical protein